MKFSLLLPILAMLGATSASGQTPDQINALVKAVEDAGCVITEMNDQSILAAARMTEAEGAIVVQLLMSNGRAVPQDDDMRLKTGKCS